MLTFLLLKSVRGIKVPPNEKYRGHNPELPMCLIAVALSAVSEDRYSFLVKKGQKRPFLHCHKMGL